MVGFKATDVPPTATVKFLGAGTAACIADLITFPLDTAKVRLQMPASGVASWQAAPPVPWPWPWPSQRMW
uniref:Uncoupling protein 2 n=1 Tax=Ovis aries TaxID=9940 RepID=A0AC11DN52_SHEEP